MNADLLRQRRNLIAISAVLLIFDFANVTIAKISVLGTELLVGNARILMVCAWILWGYFFLRYYQYWRVEPDRHIRAAFTERFDKYARSYPNGKPIQDSYGQEYKYKISRTAFARWAYTLQGYDPVKEGVIDGATYNLPVWKLAAWSVQSVAFVCVQTPHATDHILPFALAVAAPITTFLTKWQLFTAGF